MSIIVEIVVTTRITNYSVPHSERFEFIRSVYSWKSSDRCCIGLDHNVPVQRPIGKASLCLEQPPRRKRIWLSFNWLALSLQSSKSTFSHHLKKTCISEVVRIGSKIVFHLSKLWKVKSLYCVMSYFWWGCRGHNWPLLEVKGLEYEQFPSGRLNDCK